MGRIPRFIRHDQPTVYHIMSRTALDGFPLQDTEKDHLIERNGARFLFLTIQRGNKDGLIDLNLGMHEWNEFNSTEIIRKYREFVYETGAMDAGKGKRLDPELVKQERKKGFRLSRVDIFRHRCRYFSDSGIIGSKEFVAEVFDGVKHLLDSKDERRFTPVGGVEGVYSMKRLAGGVGG